MILHGRNILVYENGVPIAAAKSCQIHVECEKIEIASHDSGEWRDFIAGRKLWNVRIGSLVTSVSGNLMKVGSRVRLTFGAVDEQKQLGSDRLTGYALCTAADVTAQVGALAQGTFVFEGCDSISGLERVMVNLRDSNQNNLLDSNGNQLRVMEALDNLV